MRVNAVSYYPNIYSKPKFAPLKKDTVSFTGTVSKIKSLKGDPYDNIDEIKNILLLDMGLPSDCIQIELFDEDEMNPIDYFNQNTGNILLHRYNGATNEEIITTIRHELEHFKQALGVVKHFGVDGYRKYLEKYGNQDEIKASFKNVSTKFNQALWSNKRLYNSVDITKEQAESYIKHTIKRDEAEHLKDGAYKSFMRSYLYDTDPAEIEAYDAQNELAIKLGYEIQELQNEILLEEFPKIDANLTPPKEETFQCLFEKAMAKLGFMDREWLFEEDYRQLFKTISKML